MDWIQSPTRSKVLKPSIRKIFKIGRFAPYDGDEEEVELVFKAIGKHPELLRLLSRNGFDLSDHDRESV